MLTQLAIPSLDGLFDGVVRARAGEIHDCTSKLMPEEAAIVAHAVSKRRCEFATGRMLAHELLGGFGIRKTPLLSAVDRTPIWPDGIVGSIAHADSLCVVAVGRSEDHASIGLDVEECEPLDEDLISIVCSHENAVTVVDRGIWAKRIFCIKEAVYKAWYPLNRVPLDFGDVIVSRDESSERFNARVTHSTNPTEVHGRILVRDGWILASTTIRAATVRERSNPGVSTATAKERACPSAPGGGRT